MLVLFLFILALETDLLDFLYHWFVFVSFLRQKRSILGTPTIDMRIVVITLSICDVWFRTIKRMIFFLSKITESGSRKELLVNQAGL